MSWSYEDPVSSRLSAVAVTLFAYLRRTSTAGAFVYGVPQVASDLREAIENLIFKYSVDLTLHGARAHPLELWPVLRIVSQLGACASGLCHTLLVKV